MKKNRVFPVLSVLCLLGLFYCAVRTGTTKSLPLEAHTEEEREQVVNEEAYQAYLPILLSEKKAILQYNWGNEFSDENGESDEVEEGSPSIAFSDINGDGVKDLLYFKAGRAEDGTEDAVLTIYSYYDGSLHKVYQNAGWDKKGQGDHYCLYKVEDSNALFYYFQEGDSESYVQLTEEFAQDNKESATEERIRKKEDYAEILFSNLQDESLPLFSYERKHQETAMPYAKTLSFLKENASVEMKEEAEKEVPEWSQAFFQYVVQERQQLSVLYDTADPVMALWDMDGDNVPELIIGNNETYGTYSYAKVIKYTGDGFQELEGGMDSYGMTFGASHTADPDYPGLYFHYWRRGEGVDTDGDGFEDKDLYRIQYCYIDGNEIKETDVATYTEEEDYYGNSDQVIEYDKLCEDDGLFQATTVSPSRRLQFVTLNDIMDMGWPAFVQLNTIDTNLYNVEYSEVVHKAKIVTKAEDDAHFDVREYLTEEDKEKHLGSYIMKAPVSISFYWNTKRMFSGNGGEYNADEAKLASVLSEAVKNGKKEIEDCYKTLSFGKIETHDGNESMHPNTRASFAATRYSYMEDDYSPFEERMLFLISLGANETEYHLPLDFRRMQAEMERDSEAIYEEFSSLYDAFSVDNPYTIAKKTSYLVFISGEGRCGAVADALGKKFLDNGWDSSSVRVYSFNAPNFVSKKQADDSLPIFNILNTEDLSVQYPADFCRYGSNYFFKGGGSSENHNLSEMMKKLDKEEPKKKTKRDKEYRRVSLSGDAEIEALDEKGKPMAISGNLGVQYGKNSPVRFYKEGSKRYLLAPKDLPFSLCIKGVKEEELSLEEAVLSEGEEEEIRQFEDFPIHEKRVYFTEIIPDAKKPGKLYIIRRKWRNTLERLFYGKDMEIAVGQVLPNGKLSLFFAFSKLCIIFTTAFVVCLLLTLCYRIKSGKSLKKEKR